MPAQATCGRARPRHSQSDSVALSKDGQLRRCGAERTGDALPLAAIDSALLQMQHDATHGCPYPGAELEQECAEQSSQSSHFDLTVPQG